ncbi:hypothetical protein O6H91_07G025100 [Diphasiastrum complanatum]|uniref:Uncharacterized protein n=2 Tax=Diphasiastrum complanatum TaxID=34168 RepID=A0ACC2D3B8_DIPCM|nr:hypothetical protein O6H91_07G025100 [Diphasiastrum complanatum]
MQHNFAKHARKILHIAAIVVFTLFLWDGSFFSPNRPFKIQVYDEDPTAPLNDSPAGPRYWEAGVPGSRRTVIHRDKDSSANDFLARFLAALFGRHPSSSSIKARGLAQDGGNENKTITSRWNNLQSAAPCEKVGRHAGFSDACEFVMAHKDCRSAGLINYIQFCFCFCGKAPLLGVTSLILWLSALFYILGNTAADYFCCSLERLSKRLHLSPTVAGVTLLPFGNGAPDVFSSIAAFMGAGNGQVGFNSVLGGAVFVVCVVAGSVILLVAGTSVHLDRRCFIRDISFFLGGVLILAVIQIIGKISFGGALTYFSIYLLYAITVATWEFLKPQSWQASQPSSSQPCTTIDISVKQPDERGPYLLLPDPDFTSTLSAGNTPLPLWQWIPKYFMFSDTSETSNNDERNRAMWGQTEQQVTNTKCSKILHIVRKLSELLIEWPLSLPRRLTIPIVEEERWSQFYAVSSATLAPILVAFVLVDSEGGIITQGWLIYVGMCCGCILGILAYFTTQAEHPPRNFAFVWVCGGFFMSVFWFYFIARELVAVLVSLGVILEIDPAVLALTLLAWGNSSGDLMANLALASNGGDDVQIAISGCYAGPMFNTLVGLGLSLVLATWKADFGVYILPKDDTLFITLGFLVVGLLWALLHLSINNMQPSKVSGIGLLILYAMFLVMQVSSAVGFNPFKDIFFHT